MSNTSIYFILAEDLCRFKIGRSHTVRKRFSDLQSGCPCRLTFLGSFKAPPTVEKELHSHFDEFRICGEWFVYTDKLKMFVYYMLNSSDPLADMPGLIKIALSE